MMKCCVLAGLLATSVSAFSPTLGGSRASSVLQAEKSASMPFLNKPPLLDGSMAGDFGFDPLGLSEIDEVGIDLYWLREAELKHGRIAMLAVTGFVFVEKHGPAPGCEMATAKNQIDAFWQLWAAHPQYIVFGLIMIGMIEMISGIATTSGRESGMREPGDFGLDPLSIKASKKWDRMALCEVQHCRLAMWAAAGEILQGCTTGQGALENLSVFS